MKFIQYLVFLSPFFLSTFGQLRWQRKFEPAKLFQPNRQQFLNDASFAYDGWNEQFYFYKNKFEFVFLEKIRKKETDEKERKEELRWEIKKHPVSLLWKNAETSEIVPQQKTKTKYIYSTNKEIDNIPSYEKLLYKNLYEFVDMEVSLHPQRGIKYSLILYPGAKISDIQYTYSLPFSLTPEGNIRVKTFFGDLVEHKPMAYYKNNPAKKIPCEFILQGNFISFKLGLSEITEPVVIDPWVATPSLPYLHKVWEVETDLQGNVFAYGGDNNLRLLKYDNAGTLLWNYNTGWDSANTWMGGFIVNPQTGESYITGGTEAVLRKITPAGNVVYSTGSGIPLLETYEFWTLAFTCDLSELVIGGTQLTFSFTGQSFTGNIFQMNMNSGSIINNFTVTGTFTPSFGPLKVQEVSSICNSWTDKNTYYFLTIDSLGAFNTATGNKLFWISHGRNFDYYFPGYGIDGNKQPVSLIAAGHTGFYVSYANEVEKRDFATGNLLASATIPNGFLETLTFNTKTPHNGGIDVDSCENVYVGSINQLVKYDQNLNQLGTFPVNFSIYDVDVAINGEVAVGGSNTNTGTAYVALVNANACNQIPYNCIPFQVEILGPDTLCTGDSAWYYAQVTPQGGNYAYDWQLVSGNGTLVSPTNSDSVLLTSNSPNTLQLQVIATDLASNAKDTATKDIVFVPKPVASITGPTSVCGGSTQTYSSVNTADQYQWTVLSGNATIQGTNNQQNVSLQFGASGQVILQLVLTNANQCSDTAAVTINLSTLSSQIQGADSVCANATGVTFSANASGLNYQWTVLSGNATIQGANNQQSVSLDFGASGQVTLQLIVSNSSGCLDTLEKIITIISNLNSSILGANNICQGDTVVFVAQTSSQISNITWTISTGTILAQAGDSVQVYFPNAGQDSVIVYLESFGCKDTARKYLTVYPALNPQIIGQSVFCKGDTIKLFAQTAQGTSPSYLWTFLQGNGMIIGNNTSDSLVFIPSSTNNDTIEIMLTVTAGCSDSVKKILINEPAVILNLQANQPCYGDSLILKASVTPALQGNFAWYYDNAFTQPIVSGGNVFLQDSILIFAPTNQSSYQVFVQWTGTAGSSCPPVDTGITVTVNATPVIDSVVSQPSILDTLILPQTEMDFTAYIHTMPANSSEIFSYVWDFGDGNTDSLLQNSVKHIYPEAEGTYNVYLTVGNVDNPACYDTLFVGVVIIKDQYGLFIPNAFTPNGDGVNDLWLIQADGTEQVEISIYDRWGSLLYLSQNPNEGWNGKDQNGNPLSEGVYIYVVKVKFLNGKEVTRAGSVTLIR